MSRDWGVLGKRFTRQKLPFSVTFSSKIKLPAREGAQT